MAIGLAIQAINGAAWPWTRTHVGLRRVRRRGHFLGRGPGPFEKQTVKARWSLIKLAPLPGRSPLIRLDPDAAQGGSPKGPRISLGAPLHARSFARRYVRKLVRQREWDVSYAKSMRSIRVTVSPRRCTGRCTRRGNTRPRPAARARVHISRAHTRTLLPRSAENAKQNFALPPFSHWPAVSFAFRRLFSALISGRW